MTISEKVAYLKGLAEGLGLDTEKSKEAKLISVMVGILEEIGISIEDLTENAVAIGDELDTLTEGMAEMEAIFYGEEMDEDGCGCGHSHEMYLPCPNCDHQITIDEDIMSTGTVVCSQCDAKFNLDVQDVNEEETED